MKHISFFVVFLLGILLLPIYINAQATLTDVRDGKVYRVVKIGDQVWMAENLNHDVPGSVCYRGISASCKQYGSLYNWKMLMQGSNREGVCPAGWHIPSSREWEKMLGSLGLSDSSAGRALGIGGSSGFDASMSGMGWQNQDEQDELEFVLKDTIGVWWSSTMHGVVADLFELKQNWFVIKHYPAEGYYSCRCIKDDSSLDGIDKGVIESGETVGVEDVSSDLEYERNTLEDPGIKEYVEAEEPFVPAVKNGYAEETFENGERYEGNWVNDKRDGQGTMFYENGAIKYKGTYGNGKRNGTGTFNYPNGEKYIGYWLDDKRHGQGTYYYKSGYRYEGNWIRDLRSGDGSIYTPTGQLKYEGNFSNDQENYEGTYYYSDGTRYRGIFKDGLKDGWGVVYYPDGSVKYRGDFKDDKFVKGEATEILPNGEKYIGDFENGKPNGKGTFYYADGSRYEGGFRDGLLEGNGVIYHRDGTVKYKGEFHKDKFVTGTGMERLPNGEEYVGNFLNGERHGEGKCHYRNNDVYDGEWQHGEWHGQGVLRYADGTRYEGAFIEGKINGYGVYYSRDVKRYEGEWLNGKKHGKGRYYYDRGGMYYGDWVLGEQNGHCSMQYQNGDKYVGEFKNGKENGFGKLFIPVIGTDKTKLLYSGEWKNGQYDGEGEMFYVSGSYYSGEWSNGKREGMGKWATFSGDTCIAHFVNDQLTGTGRCKYSNGTIYIGEFENFERNGIGKYIDESGQIAYNGKWINGFRANPLMNIK